MMKIVFTPDWFLTSDVLIEVFSFLTLLSFFALAFQSYRLSKKKSVLYLGFGFFLIALGQLASILTKLVLYYDTGVTHGVGVAVITYNIVRNVDIFYYLGFFFFRLFTLLGLYTIYKLPLEKFAGEFFLYLYLITIISWMSNSYYYIYNLTALVLLIYIINKNYKMYLKDKVKNTRIVVFAFSVLAVAQFIFLFSQLRELYAVGQVMQLASYIILLILIAKIIKDGKKEKPSGNNP
ncbi:hypothetical protein HY449_00280 [Candidatus Pacearchaeota archaeon]|nr:hypothetical protein [Candidatus Pacearchaeota archaeon]